MKLIIEVEKEYYEMLKYNVEHGQNYKPFEIIANGIPYEERSQDEWIPIKTRPLTEEEKLKAIEKHDIDPDDLEYPFAWHFDCKLPEPKEGEQSVDVLVTTDLGFVKVTNFFIDYLGCPCFEDMDEAGEFVAWMPLPKVYEGETT